MIELDGATLEGGGQILRTAVALAAVTKKPCHVFNIRKNRPKPGLMPQHLLGIQSLAQLCNGKLEGDFLGSEEIKFYPGEIYRGSTPVSVKIETAGSITLVLQTLIPPALFIEKPVKISFDGGATDTFFSFKIFEAPEITKIFLRGPRSIRLRFFSLEGKTFTLISAPPSG